MNARRTNEQFLDIEETHSFGWTRKRGLTLVRGKGALVWDAEGRRFIDCACGHGAALLGHCHPDITAALVRQGARLITCPDSFGNDTRAGFLSSLAEKTPGNLNRFFICNSGTEAVEAALKIARIVTGRTAFVTAKQGFHGRTFGSLSATWARKYRAPFGPLVPGFTHVRFNDPTALEAAVNDDTAGIILEIVQGEGGVRPGTADYFRSARALCDEKGALLIIDEVQTGFGRTGRWFACEHAGLVPDLLCLGKGIAGGVAMGAVAAREETGPLPAGAHGSTFGGNPLACAAALAALDAYEKNGLIYKASALGDHMLEGLRALASPMIREVRGMGMMIGIELRRRVTPVLRALQDKGVLALPAGPMVLRLLPPLVLSEDHADTVINAIGRVLGDMS